MIRIAQPAFRTFLALTTATALAAVAGAQIEHGGAPPSTFLAVGGTVPTVTMAPVDVAGLKAEDAAQEGKGAFRFGADIPVDLGFEAGSWFELPGGDRVWRLRVASPGAYSLSFVFSEYDLPPGAELYLYDDDHSWTYGQFNVLNNKPNGQMAVRPLAGQAVTLEYFEPAWVEHPGKLRIGTVVHDYKDVFKLFDSIGADGPCEVDVACPEGVGWENQIRAVTRLIIGGVLCSGSLINNTANDGTQLFISANHCGSLNNAIFQFKYQRPNCGSGSAPTNFTVQGSTQLSANSTYDYRLVRINPAIPSTYDPYYAGWDHSGLIPASTTTIHHPQGDPKKISFDYNSPQKSGTQWRIVQWDLGVTEPGSSGSPLYTPQGRYIGQLCCGAATCSFPYDDYYGRMDAQWNLIASYLDPLGTGQSTLDGYDPSGGTGGGGPDVTSVFPTVIEALVPGSAQTVSVFGTGFAPTNIVEVNGTPLSGIPSPYTVVSPNQITLNMPQVSALGSATITVKEGTASDSGTINVVAPTLPKLQAGDGDEPVTAFTVGGIDVTMSSQVGDLFLLFWSPSGSPSTLPGVVDLAIGNNFASIFQVGSWTIPAKAWDLQHVPLAGAPPLTTFYLQGVVIRAGGLVFPVDASNRQECQVLF